MGKLVPGGREHHTWCSLWAVWDNSPGSPAVDDLEASCTCGELVVEDVLTWWGLEAVSARSRLAG